VVRAVLAGREVGVVASAAPEAACDQCHAPLPTCPGGGDPAATGASTRPVYVDVVPAPDVIVSECPGDEIPPGGDGVAHTTGYFDWTIASRIVWRDTGRQIPALATGGLE
ncbi:hypothetical protein, partial [Micromonospora sp. U21]|uniref:hypothetical protein n=1 Tax=Micromonospora sp. U21 TaxID=2824899 RepID=UPI001B377899